MNKSATSILTAAVAAALLATSACSRNDNSPAAPANRAPFQQAMGGSGGGGQGFFGAPSRNPFAGIGFQRYEVVDQKQGGLIMETDAVPQGWRLQSRIDWDYTSVNNPVQRRIRIDAPDGGAWVEGFPMEVFNWISVPDRSAPGTRSFGMIHYPNITIAEAMRHFVIGRYRGNKRNLQVVGTRFVPNLGLKFSGQAIPGDSVSVRIRYEENGQMVEEDFYALLTSKLTIPYDGPQGRTYEYHRTLGYLHSMGARAGSLDNLYPLLGFIASSSRPNPMWEQHKQQISDALLREWNRQLAAGYAQIAAAGRASQAISANNDRMLASMASARAQSNAAYAARRSAAAQTTTADFDGYIRGTEKMNDPYWGTSEHSYTEKYHWTDGQGNYQHSNDAGFNPNVGARTGWSLMTPAG